MVALQRVLAGDERIHNLMVHPAFRLGAVSLVPGDAVQVGKDFEHAAMLAAEHPLQLGVGHACGASDGPVRHFCHDGKRLFVPGKDVGIKQARIDFVDGIPGHPPPGKAEALHLEFPVGRKHRVERFRGNAAHVAVRALYLCERMHGVGELFAGFF